MIESNDSEQAKNAEQRRWELYSEHRKQAWEDIQSSTDSFDQSLLAVSSGALGVSLAFIKDVVPLKEAVWLTLLYASWVSFAACIVLTVFSFRLSIKAQERHLEYLPKYYLEGNQEYSTRKSGYAKTLTVFTWLAAALFLVGLTCTVIFCVENVSRNPIARAEQVSEPKNSSRLIEGRQPIALTPNPASEERGRQPVKVTPAPTPVQTVPTGNTSGQTSQGDAGGKK